METFKTWKAKFDKESAQRKTREEEERLKALTPREREEYKKVQSRLTGQYNVHETYDIYNSSFYR